MPESLKQPELEVRPYCFEFAMEFLGDPEEADVRAYVEGLEMCLAALRSQLQEAERDARRYRWLRSNANDKWETVFDDTGRDVLQGATLDAAIDAAIAASSQGGGNG